MEKPHGLLSSLQVLLMAIQIWLWSKGVTNHEKAVPKAVSFEVPIGPVEGNKLHDEEAEAVIKYAEQEKRAEEEQFAMGQNDPLALFAVSTTARATTSGESYGF